MSEFDAMQPPPHPSWRLKVKDFGRIANAEVEMAPLVVLLGRNNTGKSYLASLIWATLNFEDLILPSRIVSDENLPDWFKIFSGPLEANEPKEYKISKDEILRSLNAILKSRKDEIAQRVLSFKAGQVGDIEIDLPNLGSEIIFRRDSWEEGDTALASYSFKDGGVPEFELSINPKLDFSRFLSRTYTSALESIVVGSLHRSEAVYLPAARTGLMLAFKSLVAGAFETFGLDERPSSDRLPLPTVRFLQALSNAEMNENSRWNDIADFLESAILRGEIYKGAGESDPSFLYRTNSSTVLPLYAASSMVTELAPFLLLLRSGELENGLVFEEPEAHLHLTAQRCMARAIARLVNSGIPVVITTHSDTFVQELNLLMQIKMHPDRLRLTSDLNYSEDELIDPSDVKAYEFISENDKTFVVPAKIEKYGILAQSLNETLFKLADEVVRVQSTMDAEND